MQNAQVLKGPFPRASEDLTYVMLGIGDWRKRGYSTNSSELPKTLVRMGAWLMERPLAQTRSSMFAKVMRVTSPPVAA
jgi:hypothetical protein